MNHFWASLFEHLKGCGQNATLFLLALAGVFAMVTLTALALEPQVRRHLVAALPWLGLLLFVWICWIVRRMRARRRERLRHSPLSEDELSKARRKLARSSDPR